MPDGPERVDALLARWREGSDEALGELVDVLYPELKKIARLHLRREGRENTLVPTALVHEAYMKLVDQRSVPYEGRRHFLAVASRTMRRLLVDYARHRGARKRQALHVSLRESLAAEGGLETDVLALVQALERMEEAGFAQEASVVQLRYLGGLTMEETAEQLGIAPATVGRAWAFARAWLLRELSGGAPS